MNIQKKSQETLKQQKDSFLNYIKTKEKYSGIIADLLDDEELEKIDNIEGIKDHLEQKGISKEQTDSLESDYKSYLKGQGFYGPDNEYPDEIKESIKGNDKILQKIKKEILKEYKNHKDFIFLDVESLVNDEFIAGDNSLSKNIKNTFYYSNEIENKGKVKRRLEDDIKEIQKEINGKRYQLDKMYTFQFKKKKNLEKEINEKEQEQKGKEKEIQIIDMSIQEHEKNKMIAENIERIKNREETDIRSMMGNDGKYTDITLYKQAIKTINEKLKIYFAYMPDEIITKIKANITKIIEKNRKTVEEKVKSEIETMLKEYLNYFNYGENRNLYSIKTIYSKNRVDPQIMEILNKLGIEIHPMDLYNETINYNFINDVFIHTTGFDVLDEILEEGGLVSTNEIRIRKEYNDDLKRAQTNNCHKHKDVYFSRGLKINGYGHAKTDDDIVFIANTMSNFANSGYGVPLNEKMQKSSADFGDTDHDQYGYSIISESALNGGDSYSKIDVKDVYIFVSETKKEKIENNPKYKTDNANIIYIPKEYTGKMNNQIYEFIKKEIALRNKNIVKMPIPKKIIYDQKNIESIGDYKFAFCESVGETVEVVYNPIKNGNCDTIIEFLKKNIIMYGMYELKYDKLKNIFSNQNIRNNIITLPFNYPQELFMLIIIGIETFRNKRFRKTGYGGKNFVGNLSGQLAKLGYSEKEVGILRWVIERESTVNNESRFVSRVKKMSNDFSIDYNELKDFLIKTSELSLDRNESNLVKNMLRQE